MQLPSRDSIDAFFARCHRSRAGLLRQRLARNRLSSPLFDTDGFCRHLETAYARMWKRHERGEPPAGFDLGCATEDGRRMGNA